MRIPRRLTALVAVGGVLAGLAVALAPGSTAAVADGITARTSVADDGSQSGTGGTQEAMSGDGGSVAFASTSDLSAYYRTGPDGYHPNDGRQNIFVRDVATGHTVQISVAGDLAAASASGIHRASGIPPNGASRLPSISADGRYVSFETQATDIVTRPNTTDSTEIVVCDRDPDGNGVFDEPLAGNAFPDVACYPVASVRYSIAAEGWPRLTADAHRIVWAESLDSPDASPGVGIHVRRKVVRTALLRRPAPIAGDPDRRGPIGAVDPAAIATLPPRLPGVGDVWAFEPAISPTGDRIVAAVWDQGTGGTYAIAEAQIDDDNNVTALDRVDVSPGDPTVFVGTGGVIPSHPQVAVLPSGRTRVVFDADPGTSLQYFQVYAVDNAGTSAQSSVLVTAAPAGVRGGGGFPNLSADGRYVAFLTDSPGMTDGQGPSSFGTCIFSEGLQSVLVAGLVGPRAVAGIAHTRCQVAVRDLVADAQRAAAGLPRLVAQLASAAVGTTCFDAEDEAVPAGGLCNSDHNSYDAPVLSADGRAVGFDSLADDLVTGDTNNTNPAGAAGPVPTADTFVRTWTPVLAAGNLDFGTVPIGTTVGPTALTITGGGFAPAEVDHVTITGASSGDFTINDTGCRAVLLEPGQSCTVVITFRPSTAGPRTGTVNVFTPDSATTPRLTTTVSGNGDIPTTPPDSSTPTAPGTPTDSSTPTAPGTPTPSTPTPSTPASSTPTTPPPPRNPLFAAVPTSLDFGSDIPRHLPGRTRTIVVSNPGGSTLTFSDVTVIDAGVPGVRGDYTADATDCLGGVPAGGSCTISITWTGRAVGRRPATLRITDNSGGTTTVNPIALTANVPAPRITVNPGVSPAGRVVGLRGLGFAPNRPVEVTIAGFPDVYPTTTTATGTFRTSLVIPENVGNGPRSLTATMPGLDASITADGPILIVLGSLDSPGLVIRH